MQNCVFLHMVLLLQHRIGNLFNLFVNRLRYCWLLHRDFEYPWLSGYCVRLNFVRSQIRIRHVAEFVLIRGLFLLFIILLNRAAFWSYSRKCLRSAALPLCQLLFLHWLVVDDWSRLIGTWGT